jgi:murein DD-endopeptidase MepM/ murein hydrolase activator NlpD
MVFIEHADGTVMAYVHLTTNGSLVGVGDQVVQGRPIGLSGNSGCSSDPHLHVTLYRAGNSFDHDDSLPLNYRNAQGPIDPNGGLVQGADYTAGSFDPGV